MNWSGKQFARVTHGALGGTWPDYDVDDFVWLLSATSAHMVETKEAKKEGQAGRRVANHHAKILYGHFQAVWALPAHQLAAVARAFFAEERRFQAQAQPGGPGEAKWGAAAKVPRPRARAVLAALGVNAAR